MPAANTVDRQSLWLLAMLVIVGAILCIVGWQRFFTVAIAA
jgi:hypothetical protein